MKKRTPLMSCFTLFLAVVMVLSVLPAPAFAASSKEIQKELDALKGENKEIQMWSYSKGCISYHS